MRLVDVSNYIFGLDDIGTIKPKVQKALEENDDAALIQASGELQKAVIYDVKGSMVEILFHPDLELHADEVLNREDLARKIRDCSDKALILEEEDWIHLRQAIDAVPGLRRQDVDLIRRIKNARKVEVEVKKSEPEPEE